MGSVSDGVSLVVLLGRRLRLCSTITVLRNGAGESEKWGERTGVWDAKYYHHVPRRNFHTACVFGPTGRYTNGRLFPFAHLWYRASA